MKTDGRNRYGIVVKYVTIFNMLHYFVLKESENLAKSKEMFYSYGSEIPNLWHTSIEYEVIKKMNDENLNKRLRKNYYLRALLALEHHEDEDDSEPPCWYEGDMM